MLMRSTLILLLSFCVAESVLAQAANDSFARAEEIIIPQNGYGTGQFTSSKVSLKEIDKEFAEPFAPMMTSAGMDRKSAWFKFTIANTRSVTIDLLQKDTMVPQNAVGIAIYENVTDKPNIGNLSSRLTPINKFGSTSNLCLPQGEYYIQLCARYYANDTAWVRLTVNTPGSLAYDQANTALDLGKITNNKNTTIQLGCLSITDTSEYLPLIGSDYKDYSKTAWITISTDNYTEILRIQNMYVSGLAFYGKDSTFWGYRIYKGNIVSNPGGIVCIDSGAAYIRRGSSFTKYIDSTCKYAPNSYYTIQLLFHKQDDYSIYIDFQEAGTTLSKSPNPATIPATHKLGTIQPNQSKGISDTWACNALVKYNPCGSIANNYVLDSIYNNNNVLVRIDTLLYALYCTFTIPVDGIMLLSSSGIQRIILYQGDISTDCNLPRIKPLIGYTSIGGGWCLKAGTYSIQLLRGTTTSIPLGRSMSFGMTFYSFSAELPALHDTSTTADNLGNISAQLTAAGNGGISTKYYGIAGVPDSVRVGGNKLFGRFTYTTFYLEKPTLLRIKAALNGRTFDYRILLKGKATEVQDSSSRIPSDYGRFEFSGTSNLYSTDCVPLDSGWYTLVTKSTITDSCISAPVSFRHNLTTWVINQTPVYNRPHKALLINNGQGLYWTTNSGGSQFPTTRGVYASGVHYFSNLPDTPFFAMPVCQNTPQRPTLYVNYYVFKIGKNNSTLKIRYQTYEVSGTVAVQDQISLYKGSCLADSTILKDTLNIVTSCDTRKLTFCDIASGWYTLVVYRNYNAVNGQVQNCFNFGLNFVVDSSYYSAFDYAINCNDLGMIPSFNYPVYSATDFITCHTSADSTNPNISLSQWINQKYGKPQFIHDDYRTPKNIWYTFLVSGTGTINIQGLTFKQNANEYVHYNFQVFKSDDTTGLSFAQLKSLGKIDSTLLQGLEWVGQGNLATTPISLTFDKKGCDVTRYYVLVTNEAVFRDIYQVQLKVSYNGTSNPIAGNYCSNAISLSSATPSTQTGSAIINCHTIGEGFGEDGTNMGCLGDKDQVKTTWFKYTYTGTGKVDLVFSIVNGTNAPASLVKYRVLYGTCKSMTAGPCVANALASFKLDCMSSGDYYVQVAAPATATGTVQMTVVATTTTYPICKPFNLLQPLAYFTPYGGCTDGKVRFDNHSSQGESIVYRWDFGNG